MFCDLTTADYNNYLHSLKVSHDDRVQDEPDLPCSLFQSQRSLAKRVERLESAVARIS